MTPLFAKFIRPSSRSSTRSERRTSVDSFDSSTSFVISLPTIRSTRRTSASPSFFSSAASNESESSAEMMDDDNLAWGRPARKQRKFSLFGRA